MTPPAKPDGQQPDKANGRLAARAAARQPARKPGRQGARGSAKPPPKGAAGAPAKPATTLAWEQAQRGWAVAAAALAGLLPLAGGIAVNAGLHQLPSNRIGALLFFNTHVGTLWIGTVFLALGAVALGATLMFLARAVRARDPSRIPKQTPWLVGVGATLYALTGTLLAGTAPPFGLLSQAITSSRVASFATTGSQTWDQADKAFKSPALTAISIGEIVCSMTLLAAIVLVAQNAVRVGLMTRFMGYVGWFVGALMLLPIFSTLPVVQAFWFFAVAALIAGRWPGQSPPAWASGKAEPWPTMAEQRERAAAAKGTRAPARGLGRGLAARAPAPPPPPPPLPARPPAPVEHPGEARRKRKRKH